MNKTEQLKTMNANGNFIFERRVSLLLPFFTVNQEFYLFSVSLSKSANKFTHTCLREIHSIRSPANYCSLSFHENNFPTRVVTYRIESEFFVERQVEPASEIFFFRFFFSDLLLNWNFDFCLNDFNLCQNKPEDCQIALEGKEMSSDCLSDWSSRMVKDMRELR